jgi:hypothetical protein
VPYKRRIVILAQAFLWVQAAFCADSSISSTDFAAKALPVLPVEQPYDFCEVLEHWMELLRRNRAAKPSSSEMALPAVGWKILIPAQAGPVLRQAAEDFRDYLGRAMQVQLALDTGTSLGSWQTMAKAIIAGTREQLPGCSAGLQGRKDYQIIATPDRIVVCGFDERGAMYGLYNIEARMNYARRLSSLRTSTPYAKAWWAPG